MLKINEILSATNGILINGSKENCIKTFCIDSREINDNDFFIPFIGKKFDAQDFIVGSSEIISGYFIQKDKKNKNEIIKQSIEKNRNINIIEVSNIEQAFYNMAKYNREKHINIPIIAVTGSVGKTSTKEMIASILSTEKKILKTEKNYNSCIGLSYMLLKLENQDVAILEHGIDKPGEMDFLLNLSKPNYSVITLIGTSHIEMLKTRENIFKEKSKVVKNIEDKSVINGDDDYLIKLNKCKKYSLKEAFNIFKFDNGIKFTTKIYNENTEVIINDLGNHNIANALAAIKMAEMFNVKKENIINGIKCYKNYSRRFERIKINDTLIIDDTYNASLDSMISGLNTLNDIDIKRKIIVLGDMLELGEYSKELHTKIGEIFKSVKVDKLFLYGDNVKYIYEISRKYVNSILFNNKDDLEKKLKLELKKDTLIYFKASNGMKFNELIRKLK